MRALETLVDKVHQALEIMLEKIGWTLPPEGDETSRSKGSTTIKTVGKKDGLKVRFICECGHGVPFPVIEIQDEENYPPELVERWDEELFELCSTPRSFRGLELDPCDPVLYSYAMNHFYDTPQKETITGYKGWFAYDPHTVY